MKNESKSNIKTSKKKVKKETKKKVKKETKKNRKIVGGIAKCKLDGFLNVYEKAFGIDRNKKRVEYNAEIAKQFMASNFDQKLHNAKAKKIIKSQFEVRKDEKNRTDKGSYDGCIIVHMPSGFILGGINDNGNTEFSIINSVCKKNPGYKKIYSEVNKILPEIPNIDTDKQSSSIPFFSRMFRSASNNFIACVLTNEFFLETPKKLSKLPKHIEYFIRKHNDKDLRDTEGLYKSDKAKFDKSIFNRIKLLGYTTPNYTMPLDVAQKMELKAAESTTAALNSIGTGAPTMQPQQVSQVQPAMQHQQIRQSYPAVPRLMPINYDPKSRSYDKRMQVPIQPVGDEQWQVGTERWQVGRERWQVGGKISNHKKKKDAAAAKKKKEAAAAKKKKEAVAAKKKKEAAAAKKKKEAAAAKK